MRTLQSKLIAFVIGLLTLSVTILGMTFYVQLRTQLLDSVESEVKNSSAGYAFAISEWVNSKSQIVRTVKDTIQSENTEKEFATFVKAGGFDVVYAGYPDKRTVFSPPQKLPDGYDPTARPWYKGAEQAGADKIFVTKPYVDAFSGQLVMTFAGLVKEGEVKGVAAGDISLDRISKEVLALKLPGDGFGFLVHKDGTMLVHPVKESVLKPITDRVPELTNERMEKAANEGKLFEMARTDQKRYLFLVPVKGTEWYLGLSLSKDVVLAPLDRLLLVLVSVLIGISVLAALIAGGALRYMLSGLRDIRTKMQEIARGGGDLTMRLKVNSQDELGETAEAFNAFLDQLRTMFLGLQQETARLTSGVHELNQTMDILAQESLRLSDTSSANAATIEEISVTASHIADNTADIDSLMRETGGLSRTSAEEVIQVAADVEKSVSQVEELARVMSSLDARSQEISSIVSVIKGIADQTNLLALNAAIEAARAGEQGRGFAVVADEVRKLAESTTHSTVEIARMIEAVRQETTQAGDTVTATVSTVQRSVQISHAAAERINHIRNKIDDTVVRMSDIALSTREQREATTSMAQSTEQINNGVMNEDAAIQSARRTLAELSDNARRTQERLSGFSL